MNYFDPYNFYFELPIYSPIEITQDLEDEFGKLIGFEGKINGYNPTLKEQTTFQVHIKKRYDKLYLEPIYYVQTTIVHLKCLRTDKNFPVLS